MLHPKTSISAASNSRPCISRGDTLHVKFGDGRIGSLKCECDVLPSLRSVAAIPEEAVARAILFF